jgi:protocatechuate 3,4-dioxygenase beta subunit
MAGLARVIQRMTSVALAVVFAAGWLLAQQSQGSGSGVISGVVTDDASGAPLAGAVVQITGPGRQASGPGQPGRVMTTSDGRFLFRSLGRGSYGLQVTKPGYVPGAFGRGSALSTTTQSIDLADAQQVPDANIRLWKYASITGTVVDEAGEPLVRTTVKACLRVVRGGRVKLDFAAQDASAYTDDRGIYQHTNLLPGEYVVIVASASATVPASVQEAYARMARDPGASDLTREVNATSAALPSLSGERVGDFVLGFGSVAMGTGGVLRRPGPGELPLTDGVQPIYRTTFYASGTSVAEATVVTLRSGEERTGIDFQLHPVATTQVSGTVMGPTGPQPFMGLKLVPVWTEQFTNEGGILISVTMSDARGAFTFLGIPPGQYALRAVRNPPATRPAGPQQPPGPFPIPPDPTLWASMPVTVGDSPEANLVLSLRTGLRLRGQVTFEGDAAKPAPDRLAQMIVDVQPADGSGDGVFGILGFDTPLLGRVDREGRVATYGIPAGKFILDVRNVPPGWWLKSAMAGGRDISVLPLEVTDSDVEDIAITLTDRPSGLSGTVHDTAGSADGTVDVVVFPVDRAAWLDGGLTPRNVQIVRTSRSGAYAITPIPAGEYFVAALADNALTTWRDAAFLEALAPKATRVRVDEATKIRQDLQTIKIK